MELNMEILTTFFAYFELEIDKTLLFMKLSNDFPINSDLFQGWKTST
jgi:hypothetical protein